MSSSSFTSTQGHDQLSFSGFLDNILVDFPPQSPALFSSGSDNSTPKTNSSSSGSADGGETNQWEVNIPIDDGRRQKRMISNRESARRSRLRKQKHLQNLKHKLTLYQTSSQQLMKRLQFVNHNLQIVRRDNERLGLESIMLQQRLHNLHQLLVVQDIHDHAILQSAWPYINNNVAYFNDQNQPSLISY